MDNCADCGGYDIEWMYSCKTHKGVEYCRGCECPYCAEELRDDLEYYPEEDLNQPPLDTNAAINNTDSALAKSSAGFDSLNPKTRHNTA